MTEPCRLPENVCEHHMCVGCMKDMFRKGSTNVFKFDSTKQKVCVKCPICRCYGFADLNKDLDEYLKVDVQHQNLLRETFNYEFKANLDPDYLEEIEMH